jgi:hypothetical protein
VSGVHVPFGSMVLHRGAHIREALLTQLASIQLKLPHSARSFCHIGMLAQGSAADAATQNPHPACGPT